MRRYDNNLTCIAPICAKRLQWRLAVLTMTRRWSVTDREKDGRTDITR